jgi:hypothetical protein
VFLYGVFNDTAQLRLQRVKRVGMIGGLIYLQIFGRMWAGHVARMGEMRGVFRVLAGKETNGEI